MIDPASITIKALAMTIPALALVEAAAPDFGWVSQTERLGLISGLAIAVVVLWKQLGKKDETIARKDEAISQMVAKVTEAMVAEKAERAEFRRVLEDSVRAKQELTASIQVLEATLGKMPCTLEQRR